MCECLLVLISIVIVYVCAHTCVSVWVHVPCPEQPHLCAFLTSTFSPFLFPSELHSGHSLDEALILSLDVAAGVGQWVPQRGKHS